MPLSTNTWVDLSIVASFWISLYKDLLFNLITQLIWEKKYINQEIIINDIYLKYFYII